MPTAKSIAAKKHAPQSPSRAPLRRGVARSRAATNDRLFLGRRASRQRPRPRPHSAFRRRRPTTASASAAPALASWRSSSASSAAGSARDEAIARLSKIMDWLERATCYHGLFPHFMNGAHGRDDAARPEGRRRRHRRERLSLPGAALRAPIFRPRRARRETSA